MDYMKDNKSPQHDLPLYTDRMGMSDAENTKGPQRSPVLKAHALLKLIINSFIFFYAS